jgi:hypothetical protein
MSPSEAQYLAPAWGVSLAALLIPLVISLAIWLVVVPLGLRGIFEALGVDRSRAWIPFVNLATVYRLGGLSEFWLIALVIPVSGWLGAIMLFVASYRINRRLGRSGWYTVLAVVLWWAWTLALGLQRRIDLSGHGEPLVWSAQRPPQAPLTIPLGDDSAGRSGSPAPVIPETSLGAAGLIAPMPGAWQPDAPAEPSRAAQPLVTTPPIPSFAEEQPAAPFSPFVEEQREAPRLETSAPPLADEQPEPPRFEAFAGPVPIEPQTPPFETIAREELLAASAPPAPPAPPTPSTPEPAPPADLHFDDDATIISGARVDATVISPRRRARWWVQTTMGARVELTGAAAILGRRPAPHPLYPGAQLIALTDDALSVSATHAVLEFVGGEWQVTDLDSTNGVWLIDPVSGGETELGARNRTRVPAQFMLGELGVKVVQGA